MRYLIFILIVLFSFTLNGQDLEVSYANIGDKATSNNGKITITLKHRFQHYKPNTTHANDHYDKTIFSPKSVLILDKKNKFYINNLEGYSTSVYNLKTFKLEKVIKHIFQADDSELFDDTTAFDYQFTTKSHGFNIFKGKPVEGCFSHDGKYLWVTYYRRSFDRNAQDPSGVAIINTNTDEIVRVMPTGILPKMIACSPNNKYIAVTHWGDNTVGLIDISPDNPWDFKYVKHFVVGKRLNVNYEKAKKVNRDSGCGYCLRGTVFTPDSKYLLVGRMGGGGVSVFNIPEKEYEKTVYGMHYNLRHLDINNSNFYISTNVTGYIDKTDIEGFINFVKNGQGRRYADWNSAYVGKGARTMVVTSDGKYAFASVNNESKISVVRTSDMKVIASVAADSFPVGMAINNSDDKLIVTSQGKYKVGGGHSVMIYEIEYK